MKNLILCLVAILTIGCGDDIQIIQQQGQAFEGIYFCDNGSSLELIVDHQGRVTFETSGQSLNTVNPQNGSVGTHPIISERDIFVHDNKIRLAPRNYNYTSGNDIEEDSNGSNITGSKRTDIAVELTGDKVIDINIDVWDNSVNNNVNKIVASRKINCQG